MYKKYFYSRRVIDRRIRRLQKSEKSSNFLDSSSESDDEYDRINQHDQNTNTINHNSSSEFQENLNNYDNYHDDEYDNTDDLNGVHYDAWDHSLPLYNGCRLSIMILVRMLMDFLISRINLDKQNFINLLKLII
jgi:hypothetical protein